MKSRPKHQWPTNRITPEDMAILYQLRQQKGFPINQLLKGSHRQVWGSQEAKSGNP